MLVRAGNFCFLRSNDSSCEQNLKFKRMLQLRQKKKKKKRRKKTKVFYTKTFFFFFFYEK